MSFQSKVNLVPAKGWHGDFASTNVRVSLLNNGYYQAGEEGILAGSFVWVDEETNTVSNKGTGSPDGFVARELTGIPGQYLEEHSMKIPSGFMVSVFEKGEFLIMLPKEVSEVKRGDVVNVSTSTGAVSLGGSKSVQTAYKYVASAKSGEIVAISAWI
ncbi:structural cement protein Gp24 [Commensalibacter oyaizuii]|uniref:DUF2190 family protein n=1 Tax=Commensalibacter oyaizuii TaxID=3043873 RepID=A0ABT6Q3K0_9PROT|nr:hypothetical protein [Commensalibacter sp. TBRC 16381]MDI2091674.1 hypothetical protein [Commensalibacter sp. TBRC 16381]